VIDKEARKNARKLLKLFGPNGEHWTTKEFARTKKDSYADINSPNAAKWCLLGGACKLNLDSDFLYHAVKKIKDPTTRKGYVSPARFNDADGFEPVKDFLTKIANGKI
jgi:hypothetical protein